MTDGTARPADFLALPVARHLPGVNARPADGALESVAAQALAETRSDNASGNIAWHYGIRLLNSGFYWEAHEVLETVWGNALPNSRERFLVQCIIHIANARLKQVLEQPRATNRLKTLASECLERACPGASGVLMGLDARALAQLILHCEDPGYKLPLLIK